MKYILNSFLVILIFMFVSTSCGIRILTPTPLKGEGAEAEKVVVTNLRNLKTGADNYENYLPLLNDKKVGIVTNQTGTVTHFKENELLYKSIVDFLVEKKVSVQKIFAPEHGFRGTADAGEHIIDGKDTKTGLPIISLYGNNKNQNLNN